MNQGSKKSLHFRHDTDTQRYCSPTKLPSLRDVCHTI